MTDPQAGTAAPYFLMKPSHKNLLRENANTRNHVIYWGVIFILLIAGVVALAWFTYQIQRYESMVSTNTRVVATVENKSQRFSRYASNNYLTLNYRVESENYQTMLRVSNPFFSDVEVGTEHEIYYDYNDPSFVRFVDDDYAQSELFIPRNLILASTVILALILLILERVNNKIINGQRIMGELISVTALGGRRGIFGNDYTLLFNYGFQSPSGKYLTRKVTYNRRDLRGKRLPRQGMPILVLYANDAMFRGL